MVILAFFYWYVNSHFIFRHMLCGSRRYSSPHDPHLLVSAPLCNQSPLGCGQDLFLPLSQWWQSVTCRIMLHGIVISPLQKDSLPCRVWRNQVSMLGGPCGKKWRAAPRDWGWPPDHRQPETGPPPCSPKSWILPRMMWAWKQVSKWELRPAWHTFIILAKNQLSYDKTPDP